MVFGWRPDVAFFATMPAPHLVAPVGELVAKMAHALGLTPATAWFGYLVGVEGNAASVSRVRAQVQAHAMWHRATCPRFVVTLGEFVADVLGPAPAGTWFEFNGVPGISSFDPAALLEQPELKPQAWEHIKDLRRRLGTSAMAA